jgi:serine/threonine-protein kinase
MDTTLARPPIGQLLDGRYRVASLLAHGGMATVYLGTDIRLDRTIALKIMHAELANDEDFVRRFVAEARSIARLSHPNVVTVYDQGADGRTLYLAMEYVPGHTLRDLLRERGRLEPREALDIMDGVLAGLAAAHAGGIVHRDVKPENVLLGGPHPVKVADFGLARVMAGARQTKSGMIIGTAAYLAPEQVSGATADARTDVYAAGVMLFELLTGTQPHTGDTPLSVAYKHVNEIVPPPSAVVPGLPPALDTLVALATSRDPELRPCDAGQFLHAITGVRNGLPLSAPLPAAGLAGRDRPRGSFDDTLPPRPAGTGHAGGDLPPVAGPPGWHGAVPGGTAAGVAGGAMAPWPAVGRGGDGGWPSQPPPASGLGQDLVPGHELVPGLGVPPQARQSFGAPPGAAPGPAATQHLPNGPGQPEVHRTLVVSSGMDEPRHGARSRRSAYQGPSEPLLQRLLYSRRLAYVALGAAVLLVAALLGWWVLEGRYTAVPSVTGLTATAARADLANAGLKVATGHPLIDNHVRKGLVIRTVPAGGARISRGGRVTLVLSAGPHMIPMPQVTGQPLAAAESALTRAGLVPGTVRHTPSASIAAGIVISTHPGAGVSWPQPQPVTLVVSTGPPMPDFVGQDKGAAEAWAGQNHVQLNEVAAKKSDKPAGIVVHQSVPPGRPFSENQVITIVYSPGPPMVAIPNVDGMKVDQAVRVLERLGFNVSVNGGFGFFKTVVDYNPKDQAPKGSTITLQLGF